MSADNANAVLTVFAEKVISLLFDAIGREFGYLFFYKTHTNNLKTQVGQLEKLKKDVEIYFNEQTWNNAEITQYSAGWLNDVEEMAIAANKVVEDKDKLGVWCVNLKNNRYGLSKKSTKLIAKIQKLRDEAPKFDAIHQAPPAAMLPGAAANDAAKDFTSRTKILDKVMEALMDDKINVIGICSLGGIGKTTILHEVRERARTEKLFDAVAMTTVSQVINVFEIQKNLAGMLGLKRIEEVNDIIPRADWLHTRLTNGGTNLIILDDIWSEIKLKEIGIPVGNSIARCKVVIASRYQTVCTSMRTQKTIPVDVLSKDEAWHMFKKVAGDCIERDKLEEIAKEIADKCGGLPIALVTLAGALFNKKKSSWEDAHRQLRQSGAMRFPGMNKEVYLPIMVSYKLLATHDLQEAQPLLLICCQHGEDDEIEVEKLATYCLALELFKGVDKLVEARNRTYKLIEDLKCYFLLQAVEVGEEGLYERVKMHDVVRDVCLSIVSEVKEERDKVYMHIMSPNLGGGHELGTNNEVDYSKLKVLMVPNYHYSSVYDIQGTEELRVLEIGENVEIFNPQPTFEVLKNLRMLCIETDILSEDVMAVLRSLPSLEILRFRHFNISSFCQIRQLRNLKLLDLRSFSRKGEEGLIPSGILSRLNKIEVLCMGNFRLLGTGADNDIKNGESYGVIKELDSLPKLTTLQIDLMDANDLIDLQCLENLEAFLFTTKGYRAEESCLLVGKSIHLYSVVGMKWFLEAKIQFIVRSTLALRLQISDCADPLIFKEFESLENLKLIDCYRLKYVIAEGSLDKLLILSLERMENLRCLWKGPIEPLCLVNLREIVFYECSAIESIFPHTAAKRLIQLQKLTIESCCKLEGIFSKGVLGTASSSAAEIREESLSDFILLFPKLRLLSLYDLPGLKGFYNLDIDDGNLLQLFINPRVIMLPSLEKLTCSGIKQIKQIVGGSVLELSKLVACNWLQNLQDVIVRKCDSLETVFDFEGLHFMGENAQLLTLGGLKFIYVYQSPKLEHLFWQIPHGIHCFQNLETLNVDECESLGYLISSSMAHMLVNLKTLSVNNCESMREIIKKDEDYGVKNIMFPFLSDVTLQKMENLSSFCSDDRQSIEFTSLEEVVIYKCPEMKTFCCGHLIAENLQRVNLKSSYYGENILVWKGSLNETVRYLNKSDIEEGDDPERGVADEYADDCSTDEGTPMKSSISQSIVTSPNVSLSPNVVSDNNESIANSSSPDLTNDALPPPIEYVPASSTEQSVHSSINSPVRPIADKGLSDMSLSTRDDSGSSSSIPLEQGTPKKAKMPLSVVSSSNALLTPDVISPSPPVSETKEELANSSTSASMEKNIYSSADSRVQPNAEKGLSNRFLSSRKDDWKRSRIFIQGVYLQAELKTTFEELLTAKPNFLSTLRLKLARMQTEVIESAIRSLQILREHTALTISSEELAYIKDSLDDLETSGLDTAWLKKGYQRAIVVIKEQEAVSAAAKLAMLEREKMEDEAKLEASTARLDAFKAKYDALMQELEANKELSGGGFDMETCLGDGLLD